MVIETEADGIMAAETASESTENRLSAIAPVVFLLCAAQAAIVAAKIAGKTSPKPIAAALGEIIVLIQIVTAAVQNDA